MNMFSKSAIINHALSGGTMRRVMEGFVAKQRWGIMHVARILNNGNEKLCFRLQLR